MCGGAASFTYGVVSNASLLIHGALFCLAALAGLFLLWTIHSQLILPLRTIRDYAHAVAAGSKAACPLSPMPREYADLRDSMIAWLENLLADMGITPA